MEHRREARERVESELVMTLRNDFGGRARRPSWTSSCLLYCFISAIPVLSFGQTRDELATLKKRVEGVEDKQKEVLEELAAIRKELASRQRQPTAHPVLNGQDTPIRGNQSAKVTLLEYFDYECPYCTGFFEDTMPQLSTEYIELGKVKFVARDSPSKRVIRLPSTLRRPRAARMTRGSSGPCTTNYWAIPMP